MSGCVQEVRLELSLNSCRQRTWIALRPAHGLFRYVGFIQFSDGIVAGIVEPQRLSSVKKVPQHTCGCRRLTAPPCPATEEAGLVLCVWVGARRTEPWNIHSRRAMAGQWKRLWILWHS